MIEEEKIEILVIAMEQVLRMDPSIPPFHSAQTLLSEAKLVLREALAKIQ